MPHIDELQKALGVVENIVLAYDTLNKRADEAHKYCQEHLMPDAWGKNVWHAILDDAIKMRSKFVE